MALGIWALVAAALALSIVAIVVAVVFVKRGDRGSRGRQGSTGAPGETGVGGNGSTGPTGPGGSFEGSNIIEAIWTGGAQTLTPGPTFILEFQTVILDTHSSFNVPSAGLTTIQPGDGGGYSITWLANFDNSVCEGNTTVTADIRINGVSISTASFSSPCGPLGSTLVVPTVALADGDVVSFTASTNSTQVNTANPGHMIIVRTA